MPPYKSEVLVADVCPGGCGSDPTYLTVLGDTLFFNATDGKTGSEVWRSEPPYTPATTFRVTDINPQGDSDPQEITPIGQSIFFNADDGTSGRELWRSDSPYTTAVQVADIFSGGASGNPKNLTRIGWMLFFIANDSTGLEVWRSDPPYNSASTFRQTDINTNGSSDVKELTAVGLKLFFSANDGSSGQELWLLESPYLTARRVTDVAGGSASANPRNLYAIGDTLFFTANIGISGAELYKTDPPYEPTSTVLVKEIAYGFASANPANKTAIGSKLFFSANTTTQGVELWSSDPGYKPDTTFMVMDIRKGAQSSFPRALTPVGTTLFFTANDGVYGDELWKSEPPYDDTSTEIVMDLYRGSGSSNPHSMLVVDRTLFFAATHAEDGKELFRFGGYFAMPATGFAPRVVTHLPPQPADKKYQTADGLSLQIPAIAVDTAILGVPVSADGWDLSWLGSQTGYLTGTAYPTWEGNSVLTGHVYLQNGLPGPFAGLSKLKWGDSVYLTAYGQRYRYEVRSTQTIAPDNTEAVFQHEDRSWVTLITCQGYDEQAGKYRSRLMVKAVLVSVEAEK